MKGIINSNVVICRNCVYFRPQSLFGKCNQFGIKNMVSGEIDYKYASSCRDDESKCGGQGKLFIKEKEIKIFIRNAIRSPFLLPVCLTGLTIAMTVINLTH